MARLELPQFIWIPYERTTNKVIKISNIDVTDDIISAKFTRGLIGEDNGFEIELENSGEAYTGTFTQGNIIELDFDFENGTTVQFKGKIEFIKNNIQNGFTLNITGSHYTSELIDITVTAEFTNSSISDVLKSIINNNLTGYTYNNVEIISTIVSIKWNNKPFLDCIVDLMRLGAADVYIDDDKDFHMFPKNSKENVDEAVVWNDSLIELKDFGQDSVDVRNKIIVYGEAGSLPVLYTSQDTSSQILYGVKEKIITNTSIINENQAQNIGDAEKELIKNPPTKGSAECLLMSKLKLGYLTYIISPPHDITDKYRLIKYTFFFPDEYMDLFFSQDINISKLFKDRINKDIGQEAIVNPYKMLYSINFTFDDFSGLSSYAEFEIINSNIKLKSGNNLGNIISNVKITPITVTNVHLLVKGEQLSGINYYISADGTDNYQEIQPNVQTTIINQGNHLKFKIKVTSTNTLIDSMAILYK